ncbi:hypothetical protein PBY51_008461 [Eleginops maclovinus]|uniref:Uncharacterized protein n=1 Tax=Eleginops maclovinus TaxID=56733 RepID=A0AAN8AB64_ELEMC|nr:hypothetical protein PBY51_008461 [Eleginops maclovinus]
MYPSAKSKKKTTRLETGGKLRIRRRKSEDDDQSDQEEDMGGYDPAVRRMLAKAEKRGDNTETEEDSRDDESSECDIGDDNEYSGGEGPSTSVGFDPTISSTTRKEDRKKVIKQMEEMIDESIAALELATTSERKRRLICRIEELRTEKEELQGNQSRGTNARYSLRPRKGTLKKMLPVIVRGQNLEYKPWQNTDMSDIMEKLPTLQDGAHPWTWEMVGTQFAMGDIKRLLANLLGVPAMEDILQRDGLNRYVGTAVNDPELFSANRARVWRALRDTFPTNLDPDNVLIEPLGQEENPRAYVSRAIQKWRNITGNDPDLGRMEQSVLRAKILKGLPQPLKSKLAEVVGLGSMTKSVYMDHIAHQVELHRKKESDQKVQDQEILRKLNQVQLMDTKKKEKTFISIRVLSCGSYTGGF